MEVYYDTYHIVWEGSLRTMEMFRGNLSKPVVKTELYEGEKLLREGGRSKL